MSTVGVSSRRKEGPEKLCGVAKYIDDYKLPGCLYGVTLRSSIPYGQIKNIRFDPKFPWDECVIARAEDIPGRNYVALIEEDQPLLAEKRVMHAMEPILIVGHPVRQSAYQALRHIQVDYDEKRPVLSMEESIDLEQVLYSSDNVFKRCLIEKGDIAAGTSGADFVVEGEYRVPYQEQAYIENNGIAVW